jgi:hypothetical protein
MIKQKGPGGSCRSRRAGLEYLRGASSPKDKTAAARPQDGSILSQETGSRGVFRTKYIEVRGDSAKNFESAKRDILASAIALGGPAVLDCPKSSAALHEAGHCVVDALDGEIPLRASIWPVIEFGQTQWIGRTESARGWRVDETTAAEADLKFAYSQLAGVVSEALFDPDYRYGSSVDEIVTSQIIAVTAARKLQCNAGNLWQATLVEVWSILNINRALVHAIAGSLMRMGQIKRQTLERLLRENDVHR